MQHTNHTWLRWWRHLSMTRWQLRRAFPDSGLQAITECVKHSEQLHGGEIRVAIEADLSVAALLRGQTPRARALEVFAALGVWDTQARNGVLVYLCLADHSVEIVADRGLRGRIDDDQWSAICEQLQADCAASRYEQGVCSAVIAVGQALGRYYPVADRNEQSDRPVLL
ncbi:MAG: TPM domain-containing protein [Steroidobacteraceae bacterium]